MRRLTRVQQRKIVAVSAQRDEEIDLFEMPEVIDWSGAEVGKFYRPPKKPVTMRLNADVVEWLKSYGPGYQTKANMLRARHPQYPGRKGRGKTTEGVGTWRVWRFGADRPAATSSRRH